ncbi:MAG: aminopeptidase [Thermodesulfobacteriota bacterium]
MEKYADVLMWGLETSRSAGIRKGDVILLQYDLAAVRLAEALFARIMDMGMHPVPRLIPTWRMEQAFYAKADDGQLVFQVPGQAVLNENLNGAIHVLAPESLTHLSAIDPKRIAKAAVARKPLRDILVAREESGDFGWTLCMFPTPELASKAGLTVKQYAEQIRRACFLKEADPVGTWRQLHAEAGEIKKWLNSLMPAYYHVESERVDLKVPPGEKRRWIGISGHNIPSFELFLSPDWRGVEGVYYADQPSYRSGNYVRGVRLEFKAGEAVSSEAEEGAAFVAKQLAMDKGACRIGEFSLTDRRFSRIDRFMANTLFDENFGGQWGNCHIAVGSSYSDTYDGNPAELDARRKEELGFNDSALHWDLVNTEKKRVKAVMADGSAVTVYEDGVFLN